MIWVVVHGVGGEDPTVPVTGEVLEKRAKLLLTKTALKEVVAPFLGPGFTGDDVAVFYPQDVIGFSHNELVAANVHGIPSNRVVRNEELIFLANAVLATMVHNLEDLCPDSRYAVEVVGTGITFSTPR